MNIRNLIKYFIIVCLIFFSVNAFGQSEEPVLRWQSVKYSGGYIIEIRNPFNEPLVKKRISTNYYRFNLKPGKYKFRVSILNKFGKVDSKSGWHYFEVKKTDVPELDSLSDDYIFTGREKTITITGNNFTPDIKVFLVKSGSEIEIEDFELYRKQIVMKLHFPTEKAGKYKIKLVNPGDQIYISPDAMISVLLPEIPVVTDVSPSSIFTADNEKEITISGENFKESTKIKIIEIDRELKVQYKDKNTIKVKIIPSDFKKGAYSFAVENEYDQKSKTDEILKVRNVSDGRFGLNCLEISVGYNMLFPILDWADHLNYSFIGFNVNAGYDLISIPLLGKKIENIMFINKIGIESGFHYQSINSLTVENVYGFTMKNYNMDVELYYKNSFSLPVEFIFSINTGVNLTEMNSEEGKKEYSIYPLWGLGTSVRYTMKHFYFIQGGIFFQDILYEKHPFYSVNAEIRAGMKL